MFSISGYVESSSDKFHHQVNDTCEVCSIDESIQTSNVSASIHLSNLSLKCQTKTFGPEQREREREREYPLSWTYKETVVPFQAAYIQNSEDFTSCKIDYGRLTAIQLFKRPFQNM